MTTLLFTHGTSLRHDTGPGHPEQIGRARALHDRFDQAFDEGCLSDVLRKEPPEASLAQLHRVHDPAFVDGILSASPAEGRVRIDGDTVMSPGAVAAALRAAGAVVAAVDAVMGDDAMGGDAMGGDAKRAFCAMRPPGHHAEPDRAMGFCLFNSIAIGARHALAVHGIERVSIYDFDVHHGNGTQAAFEREPKVQYLSTHQWPLFPGTGAKEETGVGNIVNRPLRAGTASRAWREAVEDDILPAIDAFAPDLLMISAGFDAHHADPLAGLELVEADFTWVTNELVALAERHAQGRVVSVLEGGYDLDALAASALAHLEALTGSSPAG